MLKLLNTHTRTHTHTHTYTQKFQGNLWKCVLCNHLKFIYFFIFGCTGSSLFVLSLVAVSGATLHCGTRGSHGNSFSCCRIQALWASQLVLVVKNPPANAGDARDPGSAPGSGRSPGGRHGNPLQYSCLENSADRGAWRATVHRVTKNQTPLEEFNTHACTGRGSRRAGFWSTRAPECWLSNCGSWT